MRRIIPIAILAVLLGSISISGTGIVFAKKTDATAVEPTKNTKCSTIENKMADKATKFDNNKQGQLIAIGNMRERIAKFITKLDAKGYDTAKIKADAQTLDEMIAKLKTDYELYIAKLKETRSLACGASDEEFKAKLAEARALLIKVRQDSNEIKAFYRIKIRPGITDLRNQKLDSKDAPATPSAAPSN